MRIDERKFYILQAIIDDYIMTASPVGSRTISRKSGVGLSSATIRNEMSDLEELGYLDSPHTSAGRVPSAKAYRWYVNQMKQLQQLSPEEIIQIRGSYDKRSSQVDDVIRHAAQVLSDVTKYTSIVVAPQVGQLIIKRMQIVPISDGMALMVIVTDAGIVKDTIIRVPDELDSDTLYMISQMITHRLENKTVIEASELFAEFSQDQTLNRELFTNMVSVLNSNFSLGKSVVVGGHTNLLQYPEYNDIEKVRNFLAVLEEKDKLAPLMSNPGGLEFTIRIGPENNIPEMKDCSLVTATYRVGGNTKGTIGIIGPTRMNYSRVVSVLDLMGKSLSEILSSEITPQNPSNKKPER